MLGLDTTQPKNQEIDADENFYRACQWVESKTSSDNESGTLEELFEQVCSEFCLNGVDRQLMLLLLFRPNFLAAEIAKKLARRDSLAISAKSSKLAKKAARTRSAKSRKANRKK